MRAWCEKVGGGVQSGGRWKGSSPPPSPSAPLHPSWPGATVALRPLAALSGVPLLLDLLASSLEVRSDGSSGARGVQPAPTPPLLFLWRRPGLPSWPRTAWCGSSSHRLGGLWRDGWWFPAAGPLARLGLPRAAGPGWVCRPARPCALLWAQATWSPGASPRLRVWACSQPPFPTYPVAVLSGSPQSLAPLPLLCPLPAWSHTSFRSPSCLCPWWWGEKGAWGAGRGPGS